MFELIVFVIAGVVLYFAADWILNRIEVARGSRFQHRSIVYFLIILILALALFQLIGRYGPGAGG